MLPAFNEESSLKTLLDRTHLAMMETRSTYEVIVVDDGSTDRTLDIAESLADQYPITIVKHSTNLGLGAAIRDGLVEACGASAPDDVIVTLDADNTHTPELIVRMNRMIREGHDVVIASRYQRGGRTIGLPLSRRLVSWAANLFLAILFRIPGVRDYTTGYRAYKASALQQAIGQQGDRFFTQDGFQVMVDILLKMGRDRTLIIGEVPLILRYDFKKGESKMDLTKTAWRTLGVVGRHIREGK